MASPVGAPDAFFSVPSLGQGPRRPTPILQLAWQRYLGQLSAHPLRTKALTSAVIAGASDVLAQHILAGRYTSMRRTMAVALYGLLWNGPSAHYWQQFMQALFRGKNDLTTVLRKVVFDQATYGPLCNVMFMSFASLVLQGQSMGELGAKIRRDYVGVQLNGWKLWPVAALINYKFVPLHLRVLFVNLVAFVWSTFLLLSSRK